MPRRGVSLYIVIMICVRPYARIVRPHPPPGSARRRTDGRAAPPSRAQAENRAALPHIQNNAGRASARRCFFLHKTAAGCTCLRNPPRVRDQNRRKRRSKRNAVKSPSARIPCMQDGSGSSIYRGHALSLRAFRPSAAQDGFHAALFRARAGRYNPRALCSSLSSSAGSWPICRMT